MCIATCLIIVCGLVAAHHSASNDPPPGASRAPSEPAQVRIVAGAVPGMYEAHHPSTITKPLEAPEREASGIEEGVPASPASQSINSLRNIVLAG